MRSKRTRVSEMQNDRDVMNSEEVDLKNEGLREHVEKGHGQQGSGNYAKLGV